MNNKNSANDSNPLIKVSGLWKNTSRNGENYFTGKLSSNSKWIVMKNGFKKNESDPDFILYITATSEKKATKPASTLTETNSPVDVIPFFVPIEDLDTDFD